jgi:ATP synthase protein I
MSDQDDQREGALDRLDDKLDAFEAKRAQTAGFKLGASEASGQGYRVLGEMLGGLLGGLGLGWLVDQFAHTGPWGLIVGLAVGAVFSVFAVVNTAKRMTEQASRTQPAPPSVPDEDDD